MAPPTESIDDFSLDDLRRVVATLVAQVDRLQADVAARDAKIAEQADEIARLKGLPPRPKFKGKPSGMEQSTTRMGKKGGRKVGRGPKRDKLTVTTEIRVKAVAVPQGSRFRGYEECLVQDLRLQTDVTLYQRERWQTPEGKRIVAPLPRGVMGGFGPELRRFILACHFQGQVTSERLTAILNGMGLVISKRQVVRLLSQGLETLEAEDQEVLKAGLETAHWITVDDTAARHAKKDVFTTQLGDDRFAVFRTGPCKSRRRFLSVLQCGREDHVVDDAALARMRQMRLSGGLIDKLAAHPDKRFTKETDWLAHLTALGFDKLKITPDPVKVATEGALWGAVKEQGLINDTVIVSDGAGQFRVADHALCWVHAERLVYKLEPTNADHRKAVELARNLIWWFYRDLKAYKRDPTPQRASEMRARFDRLFTKKTGFILLDKQLRRLHGQKGELLRVLDRPEIPLHTNGSENDIRSMVTKRKVSGGTVSEAGKAARDTLLGLMKTGAKLNVSVHHYLGDRLSVQGAPPISQLPDLVRAAAA